MAPRKPRPPAQNPQISLIEAISAVAYGQPVSAEAYRQRCRAHPRYSAWQARMACGPFDARSIAARAAKAAIFEQHVIFGMLRKEHFETEQWQAAYRLIYELLLSGEVRATGSPNFAADRIFQASGRADIPRGYWAVYRAWAHFSWHDMGVACGITADNIGQTEPDLKHWARVELGKDDGSVLFGWRDVCLNRSDFIKSTRARGLEVSAGTLRTDGAREANLAEGNKKRDRAVQLVAQGYARSWWSLCQQIAQEFSITDEGAEAVLNPIKANLVAEMS